MPGLRVGWTVAPSKVIERIWRHHDYSTLTPGLLSDRLTAVAMQPHIRENILARTRGIIRANLPLLESWLATQPALHARRPVDGAIAFAKVDLPVDSATSWSGSDGTQRPARARRCSASTTGSGSGSGSTWSTPSRAWRSPATRSRPSRRTASRPRVPHPTGRSARLTGARARHTDGMERAPSVRTHRPGIVWMLVGILGFIAIGGLALLILRSLADPKVADRGERSWLEATPRRIGTWSAVLIVHGRHPGVIAVGLITLLVGFAEASIRATTNTGRGRRHRSWAGARCCGSVCSFDDRPARRRAGLFLVLGAGALPRAATSELPRLRRYDHRSS